MTPTALAQGTKGSESGRKILNAHADLPQTQEVKVESVWLATIFDARETYSFKHVRL